MSKKLIINTNLLRKESEFRTKSCLVEKAIAVSHGEFEYLKSHPLRDNDLIAENTDLMYCDSDDNYHCLLIYDEEQDDIPHPQSPIKTIEMTFIPEGDVYRLVAHSKLPGAVEFESWIFDKILPQINRTGGYVANEDSKPFLYC